MLARKPVNARKPENADKAENAHKGKVRVGVAPALKVAGNA